LEPEAFERMTGFEVEDYVAVWRAWVREEVSRGER
jgi:hypothetical protein